MKKRINLNNLKANQTGVKWVRENCSWSCYGCIGHKGLMGVKQAGQLHRGLVDTFPLGLYWKVLSCLVETRYAWACSPQHETTACTLACKLHVRGHMWFILLGWGVVVSYAISKSYQFVSNRNLWSGRTGSQLQMNWLSLRNNWLKH